MITHILKTQRRTKIVYKEIPLIFGISGLARCGKDTFAKYLSASAVKKDLDNFTKENLNISSFTENKKEKEIIRPLLVSYATDVCRNKIDKDFWIKKVSKRIENSVENKIIVLIPDVRYENEAKWIKKMGGYVIHIHRINNKPANFEEKANDPIVKNMADFKIKWKDFNDEKQTCHNHIAKLFKENGWSLYGEFK
jgi:hypothetical protein